MRTYDLNRFDPLSMRLGEAKREPKPASADELKQRAASEFERGDYIATEYLQAAVKTMTNAELDAASAAYYERGKWTTIREEDRKPPVRKPEDKLTFPPIVWPNV